MPFSAEFNAASISDILERTSHATSARVRAAIDNRVSSLDDAAALVSPAAADLLEEIAQSAQRATVARFGKTVSMFAPLYLSNECVCTCTYCGFSMGLDIRRRTLRVDEVMREAKMLAGHGFRNILLVSAEHPKLVGVEYVAQCIRETK